MALAPTPVITPRNRTWTIILGVLALILGVFGLFTTVALTIVSTLWFGVLIAVVGVIGLINTFRRGRRTLGFVLGALYLVAGVLIALQPATAAVSLTLLIAAFLIASGILRLVYAGEMARSKALAIIGGVASILLGGLLILGWPVTGLYAIGLFVALDLIFFGATALALGIAARSRVDTADART